MYTLCIPCQVRWAVWSIPFLPAHHQMRPGAMHRRGTLHRGGALENRRHRSLKRNHRRCRKCFFAEPPGLWPADR